MWGALQDLVSMLMAHCKTSFLEIVLQESSCIGFRLIGLRVSTQAPHFERWYCVCSTLQAQSLSS